VITSLWGADKKLRGFTKVTRDLTERKRAEVDLKRANETLEKRVHERTRELESALKSRDEFLSIASHELKTPLTSLKLQLQTLRRKIKPEQGLVPAPPELAKGLDIGAKHVNSIAGLVEDLLDVSRIQAGKFDLALGESDLSEIVEEVVARFAQQLAAAGCTPELHLEKQVKGVWDRHRLEQVVVNLLTNAIKYAPKKPIRVRTHLDGDIARLMVQDSGPGIENDLQKQIFERFERVNQDPHIGGLGLGLFIVRRIVEAHHGRVWVESKPGDGAKFIVELPCEFKF
jgi:signal transduction histidine kinase